MTRRPNSSNHLLRVTSFFMTTIPKKLDRFSVFSKVPSFFRQLSLKKWQMVLIPVWVIPMKKFDPEMDLLRANCSNFCCWKEDFGIISVENGLSCLHLASASDFVAAVCMTAMHFCWSNHSNPIGQTGENRSVLDEIWISVNGWLVTLLW